LGVFDNLRRAFQQAAENFRTELHRDEVPDTVDELLRHMRGELVDARVYIKRLRDELEQTERSAEAEAREAETCRRRERLALSVPDAETADVARQYAERHEQRRDVLRRKAQALREELNLRVSDAQEMEGKLREAHTRREEVISRSGRVGAHESMHATEDLFAELDRMAEKIRDTESYAEAAEKMLDLDRESGAPPREPAPDVDERLAELKRRMGRE